MANEGGSSGAVWALVGCAGLLVMGLCLVTAGGVYMVLQRPDLIPPTTPTPLPPDKPTEPSAGDTPRHVRAEVTTASAGAPVATGATCEFDVEHVGQLDDGRDQCRAQVLCGGRLLYGGPQAGYFPCQLDGSRNVVGQDVQTTSEDRDGAMRIDTNSRLLTVHDDATGPNGAYQIEARITSVQ